MEVHHCVAAAAMARKVHLLGKRQMHATEEVFVKILKILAFYHYNLTLVLLGSKEEAKNLAV